MYPQVALTFELLCCITGDTEIKFMTDGVLLKEVEKVCCHSDHVVKGHVRS